MVHRSIQGLVCQGIFSKGMFTSLIIILPGLIARSFLGKNWTVKKRRLQMTPTVA